VRVLFVLLALGATLAGQPAADEIVRKAVERDKQNWLAARNYTFLERQVRRTFDGDGNVKDSRVRTYDVTLQEGSPYRRLISENGKPLDAKRRQKEDEKLRKSIEPRRNETPEQRRKRLAEEEKERERSREFTQEIPVAFHLKVTGSETIAGHDCWVIEGAPKAGYKPRTKTTRIFPHIKGKLWIDKQDYSLVRGEAEVIDTVSWGLFLARIHSGTKILFEQARVNDEVWLPRRIYAQATGRLGLIKKLNLDMDIRYQDYRKFLAESRIVSTAEVQ
jgi:hypothetical protein